MAGCWSASRRASGSPPSGQHRRFVTAIAHGRPRQRRLHAALRCSTSWSRRPEPGADRAAISIASAVSLPAGPLLGAVVDRLRREAGAARRQPAAGVGFLAYLVTDSFVGRDSPGPSSVTIGRTAFWGSYGNIVAAISQPGERERWFGFLGALRNVGFAVGGLRLGRRHHDRHRPRTSSRRGGQRGVVRRRVPAAAGGAATRVREPGTRRCRGSWGTVLRDRPYRLLVAAQVAYSVPMMVLNFAMPVYAVTVLGLPGWVAGGIFTLNT